MSILYIYNSEKDKIDCQLVEGFSYKLNCGEIKTKQLKSINDEKRLNEIALEQRDDYSEYIYSLNSLFIKNKLIYEKNLSFYFLSDLSGKKTLLYNTYVSICHVLLIKEKLKEQKIEKIIFEGCETSFVLSMMSIYNGVDVEVLNKQQKYAVSLLNHIRQIKFFFTALIKIILIKFVNIPKVKNQNINTLYLSSYPTHFDKNFIEDKYGYLKHDDYYLISVLTDGRHQSQSVIKYLKDIINLKFQGKRYILIDSSVVIIDLFKAFLFSCYLIKDKNKLKKESYIFKSINISHFMKEEIDDSFIRIPRLLVFNNSIKKIFSSNKISNFTYYLFEFSYGRFFTYMLNSYFPKVRKIGFQHGAPSRRSLLCYLAKNEPGYDKNDFFNYLPMPDMILVENKYFKFIYEESGYRNINLMKSVHRLKYLKSIHRTSIEDNTVLIIFGMHDYNITFNQLISRIQEDRKKKYIFKFHPRTNPKKIIGIIKDNENLNVTIADKHVSYYLSFVSKVIVTYSSVGYEAYLLGIPTEVISLPNRINESPLLDIDLLKKYI